MMRIDPSSYEENMISLNHADKASETDAYQHHLFMQTPVAIMILKGGDYLVELANDDYLQLIDKGKEFINKPIFDSLPELKMQGMKMLFDGVMNTGEPYHGNELEVYIVKNGQRTQGYYNFVARPILKENDNDVVGIIVVAQEVTEQVNIRRKAERKVTMLENLWLTAPGFVAILRGPTHIYEMVNEPYQKIFGKRQILGLAIMDALPELEGQGFDTLLDNVYQTGEKYLGFDVPILLARDEGLAPETCYFNFSYQPMFDDNHNIDAILVLGYEVTHQMMSKIKNLESEKLRAAELEKKVQKRTEQLKKANLLLQQKNKELEDAQEKLLSQYSRTLIEASLDPLVTIDADGKITDVNEASIKVTGMLREKLIGTDFSNYFTEPSKAQEGYQHAFEKGFVADYPLTIKHNDGTLTDVLYNASVYKDDKGNVLGVFAAARDVTEQKRIEKELIEARIFAELATSIAQEAKSKAETAVKSKQQFLSNMSHEIRTPMNAIIGFTKVVLKTELSAKQKEYLTAIKMSGDALIVLINDILDLAKVEAGKMSFEKTPFKLALSISTMVHLFETKIQEKNLELIKIYDPKIPEVLVGDPLRLHQIIMNLLSNAVKFTSKGGITLSVSLLEEDDQQVIIEFAVTDTGIGIPVDKLDEIFENFHQASSETSRVFDGTGLGLAIVKQLVEPQGGHVHVKSTIDVGTTFSFNLSFQKTNEKAEIVTEIMEIDDNLKNIKVLVVEDMALNQLLMKTVLDDFGFERDIAENGKIAIEKLTQKDAHGATKDYDIILMDLQMPEMNGFEATEYIRKTLKSEIPIIALTADVTTVDLAKCKAVGMNDYIAKPIDERVLYSKIVSFVKKPASKNVPKQEEPTPLIKQRCTNLEYLMQRTKSNPILISEMIAAYLEQTPPLIQAMKQSFQERDWAMLHAAVHKMIPSFSIMGIHTDFESMAKKVVEYARIQEQEDTMSELVSQLENICVQACEELREELTNLQNIK